MTSRHRLHTKESRVAMDVENFGVSENTDIGGGINSSLPRLAGTCGGGFSIVVQAERRMSDRSSFGNDWIGGINN